MACFLPLPEEKGEEKNPERKVLLSFIFCFFSLFCLFLHLVSASLCIFLLLHLFALSPPTPLASSLCCPALRSIIIFMCHFSSQGPVLFPFSTPSPKWSLPSGAAYLHASWVSQTFLGVVLPPHSHLYPLLFPRFQTLKMFRKMEFQRSVRWHGRWAIGAAFFHTPLCSQVCLLFIELSNSWWGAGCVGWAGR